MRLFKKAAVGAMSKLSGSLTNPGVTKQYLITGTMTATRFLQLMPFTGKVPTNVAPATTFPAATGLNSYAVGVSATKDGSYLAAGCWNASPYLVVLKRAGDTFGRLTLDIELGSNCMSTAFSPDSAYLAASSNSHGVGLYKRTGDNFNRSYALSGLPTQGSGVAFSPDSQFLAMTAYTGVYNAVYKRTGDTFTKLSVAGLAGYGRCCSFSPDGNYLAFGHSTAPYLSIFKRDGDTFNRLFTLSANPTYDVYSLAWSPDSKFLFVGTIATPPYLHVYERTGDTFTKKAAPASMPVSAVFSMSVSPDGKLLACNGTSRMYDIAADGTLTYFEGLAANESGLNNSTAWFV